jgi:hypothetical protein
MVGAVGKVVLLVVTPGVAAAQGYLGLVATAATTPLALLV